MKKIISNKSIKPGGWEEVRDIESGTYPSDLLLGSHYKHQLISGHLIFTLARYKFASKLIERTSRKNAGENARQRLSVLELGCNEGIGTLLLSNVAREVIAVDSDQEAITWSQKYLRPRQQGELMFICDDFLGKNYGKFDAVVAIDVIEHIPEEKEKGFLSTVCDNLKNTGFCIIGTPNKTAEKYASETSRKGHVNLYSAERLEEFLSSRFNNVFMFGMNDEVIHTGFKPMAHYLMALACHRKS